MEAKASSEVGCRNVRYRWALQCSITKLLCSAPPTRRLKHLAAFGIIDRVIAKGGASPSHIQLAGAPPRGWLRGGSFGNGARSVGE